MGRRKGGKNRTPEEIEAAKLAKEGEPESKLGRPEGSVNLTPEEIRANANQVKERNIALLTFSKKHVEDELSFFELYSGYFEKNVKYYPLHPIFFSSGGIAFIKVVANQGLSREYYSSMNANMFDLGMKKLEDIPKHLLEIMRHNRKVMEIEWKEVEPIPDPPRPVLKVTMPVFGRKEENEVYDRTEDGELIVRKSLKGRGHLTPERRAFLDKLKSAKANAARDEIVKEVDGKIVIRKKMNKGMAVSPERRKQIDALKAAKAKCKSDEVVELNDKGKIIIRKKKPRGKASTLSPERRKLVEGLKQAKAKLKKGQVAEIVGDKVVVREAKPRGRQVGWKLNAPVKSKKTAKKRVKA